MTLTRTTRLALRLVRLAATEKRLRELFKNYPKITPDKILDMETVDPTGNKGSYLEWVVNRVSRGNIRWPEDKTRVLRALKEYNDLKKQPRYLKQHNVSADINQYTLHDLEKINRSIHGDPDLVPAPGEQILPATKWFATMNGGRDKILRIGGPGTDLKQSIKSACTLGEGTKWCTGGKDAEDSARHYLEKGPLFIIYRDGQPYAQTDRDQLMDVHDYPIEFRDDEELWHELAEIGIFSKAKIAYAYAYYSGIRNEDGEKDIVTDKKYRYLYITTILGVDDRWPEAEPYILRDKNPEEIYKYCRRCLNKKRWPAGEKVLLTLGGFEAEYLVLYAKNILNCSWPEAESRLLSEGIPSLIVSYAAQCKSKQRWPEAEAVLLGLQPNSSKGVGDVDDIVYHMVHYAIDNIGGRWPEAEPVIVRGVFWFSYYCRKLNIDPTEVINNVISRAKKEGVDIAQTYPQIIMPVE
jgi:hypothetical protein